jgi:hypothetical protein
MTLDVYADLFNDDLDDVAHRLHEAASPALDEVAARSHPEGNSVTTTEASYPRRFGVCPDCVQIAPRTKERRLMVSRRSQCFQEL